MSLRVTGYTPEGKRIVIDEGPSSCRRFALGGSLVTGIAPTPPTTPADVESSRRYRAAHPDRIRESNRRYRARKRAVRLGVDSSRTWGDNDE